MLSVGEGNSDSVAAVLGFLSTGSLVGTVANFLKRFNRTSSGSAGSALCDDCVDVASTEPC